MNGSFGVSKIEGAHHKMFDHGAAAWSGRSAEVEKEMMFVREAVGSVTGPVARHHE